MTLKARLAQVKRVPAGTGVSYGHRYVTTSETTWAWSRSASDDGVPRAAADVPWCRPGGRRWPMTGTVCMDQFVVDFGDNR